jgi:hypothetical protein
LHLRGETVRYDPGEQRLRACRAVVPAPLKDGVLRLRVLLDRAGIELCAGGGEADVSGVFFPREDNRTVSLQVAGPAARVRRMVVRELASIYDAER